jgi:hypothetical protein
MTTTRVSVLAATISTIIAVLLLGILPTAASAAPGGLSDYTWDYADGNNCVGRKVDPINVVWIDRTFTTVRDELWQRLRWPRVSGSYQYTGNNGKCTGQNFSAGRERGRHKRHVRLFESLDYKIVSGDAHRERKVTCRNGKQSDAVYRWISGMSGFDRGAWYIRRKWPRKEVRRVPGWRDDKFQQCNGEFVRWSGEQALLYP